jgi:hypothetical protein
MIGIERQKIGKKGRLWHKTEIWQYERERKRGNDRDGSYGHRE